MNNITIAVPATSSLFTTKEEYLSFKAHWRDLANTKAINPSDAALRILVLNQDAERSMPPTKNPVRLANGALYGSGLFLAMNSISHEARRAKQALTSREQGDNFKLTSFSERWAKHGVSLELLASLAVKANSSNLPRIR